MKQKVVVFGSEGLVGSRFLQLNSDHFEITAPGLDKLDLLNTQQLDDFLKNSTSSCIVNFAAFTNVDKAEEEKDNIQGLSYKLNTDCVAKMSQFCREYGKHLVHISTDYIFDGTKKDSPYTEEDNPNPLSWYGKTKYFADEALKKSGAKYTIARIQMPYRSQFPLKQDVVRFFLSQLKEGNKITAVDDQVVTPVFIDDLVLALRMLIQKQAVGTFHLVASNWTTPFDLAKSVATIFNLDENLVSPIKFVDYNKTRAAKRPQFCWLDSAKFRKAFGDGILHSVEEGLQLFKKQLNEG